MAVAKAYLVGSGIASLSAAAFLIREGGFAGDDIVILEEQDREGGSLDTASALWPYRTPHGWVSTGAQRDQTLATAYRLHCC